MRHAIRLGVAAVTLGAAVAVSAVAGSPPAGASAGSWSIVSSPNTSSAQDNVLNGVSCRGPAFCVAVGFHGPPQLNPIPPHTLIEAWNGSVWSIVPSPNVPPTLANPFNENILEGVSCSGTAACMAVGRYFTGQSDRSLIESWNGSVWSIMPSPNVGSKDDQLNRVSCTGPAACIAVGGTTTNSGGGTLIESWNGSAWSIVPSPDVPNLENQLNGVSCSSSVACVAVGVSFPSGTFIDQTLIESWNGSVWSIVPSPNASPNDGLAGVSCSGASACMAVGAYSTTGAGQTLIESWNGSTWSIVPSPNTSPTHANDLSEVACSSSRACMAVGGYNAGNPNFGPGQTLIEAWNGTTWSIVPSPNPSHFSLLNAVACTAPTACTAAGFYSLSNDQTLIEHLTASPTPPGSIFATTFTRCNTLHVGYNRFTNGTIVHWNVTTNGVGTVASGHFTAIGGGKLGAKTNHFIDIPLGTTLPSEASGIQSHMHFHWANGGTYAATRDPGC